MAAAQPALKPPVPFTVNMSDEQIARLRRKVEDYALPAEDIVPDAEWKYGVSLDWLKELRDAWLSDDFDWRAIERELNQFPQFQVEIEGVNLHYIHQKSTRTDAVPLILCHGWPGSCYEFISLIEPLTNPPNPEDPAFHVIVPSVPGFLFSSTPPRSGWTVADTACIFDTLVTNVLGYTSYACQGGDWGSIIAPIISDYPRCRLVHLNMCTVPPPYSPAFMGLLWLLPNWLSSRIISLKLSPEDWEQLMRTKNFATQGAGYFALQSTQPLTIGLALNDNPMGLLVWIGEKYHAHIDPGYKMPARELLKIVSLYWFTQSFASSCLPYHENTALFGAPPTRITDSALAVSVFKHDILIMPRYWIEKWHKNRLVFYRAHERGGHFPAIDNPDDLVQDLRDLLKEQRALFVPAAEPKGTGKA